MRAQRARASHAIDMLQRGLQFDRPSSSSMAQRDASRESAACTITSEALCSVEVPATVIARSAAAIACLVVTTQESHLGVGAERARQRQTWPPYSKSSKARWIACSHSALLPANQ